MPRGNYPATVIEVIDDDMRFRPAILQAVQSFAESKPWTGSLEARKQKFRSLNRKLAKSYGIKEPQLVFGRINGSSSGGSYYDSASHRVVLTGKLSVVTFLHEFAHALGKDEMGACRWSINLFKCCFPRQFSQLVHVGHMLVQPQQLGADDRGECVR